MNIEVGIPFFLMVINRLRPLCLICCWRKWKTK